MNDKPDKHMDSIKVKIETVYIVVKLKIVYTTYTIIQCTIQYRPDIMVA